MVTKTPLRNENGHSSPASDALRGVASLSRDILRLVELQARLAKVDASAFAKRAILPCLALAGACMLALAAFAVGLLGTAQILSENTNLTEGVAQMIVAMATLLVCATAGVIALSVIKSSTSPLARSRDELVANYQSIADALHRRDQIGPI